MQRIQDGTRPWVDELQEKLLKYWLETAEGAGSSAAEEDPFVTVQAAKNARKCSGEVALASADTTPDSSPSKNRREGGASAGAAGGASAGL